MSPICNGYVLRVLPSDSDSDGMLDAWEILYGLNVLIDDSAMDTDLDGLSNYGEYIAGTDPTNSTSVLALDNPVLLGASNLVLNWQSVSGKSYSILGSTNLLNPDWIPVQTNLPAIVPMNATTINVENAEAAFYQIEVK